MNFGVGFFISQGISVLTAIFSILAEQMKKMKHILIVQTVVNLLAALSYVFLEDGRAGFIVSMIGTVQSIIMYIYDKNGKKPHVVLTLGFVAAYLFLSLYNNTDKFINFLPAAAAVCFALAIMQNKPKMYRVFDFSNAVLWLVYDACILSGNFFVHLGIAVSAMIGMIRLDGIFNVVKKQNEEQQK